MEKFGKSFYTMFNGKLRMCSLNVRGLGDRNKRRSVFNYIHSKNIDIAMLQETHLDNQNKLNQWKIECKSEICASFGTTQSKGVMIIVKKKKGIKILDVETDNDGRICCMSIEVNGKTYVISNIYAPNFDDETFMYELIKIVDKFQSHDGIYVGGDFNFVIDPKLDRNDSNYNHYKMAEILNTYMEKIHLNDIWRLRNPDVRRYTWHRWSKFHKPMCSRIDMILISAGIVDQISKCSIEMGHMSDHSLVLLEIKLDNFRRGTGTWKFNNQRLNVSDCNGILCDISFCTRSGLNVTFCKRSQVQKM